MPNGEEVQGSANQENGKIANEILKILSSESVDEETRNKQEKILEKIPNDIVERLLGHLKAAYIEDLKYNKTTIDRVVLSGEIFEMLVEIQDDLEQFNTENFTKQTEKQKEIGEALLSVMANPDRYGLEFDALMNPDRIRLYFQDQDDSHINIEITGSLEIKKHFDYRSLYQIKHFLSSFNRILQTLSSIENLDDKGLALLSKNQVNLSISDDYKNIFVIPRGSKPEKMISKMSKGQKKTFLAKIHDSKEVGIVESVFSREELILINEYFYKKVMTELKTEDTETFLEQASK